uniref:NADH-ubiquinone oxidoreductase chain 2 n=1 Tax=Arge similis TaxID=621222 RepID=A0A3S8V079_9HYME|nr:NADH dehydrogenase subunit 2 [Arge similis]
MMNKNFKFIYMYTNSMNMSMLMMLLFSTYMAITSMSWLNSWIFLEMNMMTFIPLMINKSKLNKSTNSMIKYFIVQSFSSSFLLLSFIILNFSMMNEIFKINYLMKIMISIALMIKLGMTPFHWWMPHIMIKLNWKNCLLLLTWQKLIPLILLYQINENFLMNLCAMMSMIFGSIMGMNQTSIKLLMTYSSINHIGWIIINMLMNKFLMMLYFLIYSLTNMIICLMMNNMNIIYMNQLFKNFNKNQFNKMFLMMMILSMGGLPPLLGFFPKMISFIMTLKNFMLMESMIMIFTTLITLKFYMNLMLPMLNIYSMKIKFSNSKYYINEMNYSLIINMMLSFMMMTMINYLP